MGSVPGRFRSPPPFVRRGWLPNRYVYSWRWVPLCQTVSWKLVPNLEPGWRIPLSTGPSWASVAGVRPASVPQYKMLGCGLPPSLGTLMAVCRQPDAAASLPLSGFSRIHATRRIPWQSSLEESLVSKPGGIVGDLAFPLDKMGNLVGLRAVYPPLGPIVSCNLKLHVWSLRERLRLWVPTAACRSLSSPSPPLHFSSVKQGACGCFGWLVDAGFLAVRPSLASVARLTG